MPTRQSTRRATRRACVAPVGRFVFHTCNPLHIVAHRIDDEVREFRLCLLGSFRVSHTFNPLHLLVCPAASPPAPYMLGWFRVSHFQSAASHHLPRAYSLVNWSLRSISHTVNPLSLLTFPTARSRLPGASTWATTACNVVKMRGYYIHRWTLVPGRQSECAETTRLN
jgi:hypothetical protein